MPTRAVPSLFALCLRTLWIAPILAFLCRAAAGGVDPAIPAYLPEGPASGTVSCLGADNMNGILDRWARALARIHPGLRLEVARNTRLSAEGLDALLEGRTQVAPFVREIYPAERRRFLERFGHEPLLVWVAGGSYATKHNTHAIAIYVNAANPLKGISLGQLERIFSGSAPAPILTWGQLGLSGEWAGRPVRAYGMPRLRGTGNPPGIVNYFEQRILGGREFGAGVAEVPDRAGVESLDGIVRAVASDPGGIGYSGFGNRTGGVRAVPVAEADTGPFVAGTPETVADRTYPLSRQIYLCVNRLPGQPLSGPIRQLLRYALSREGQEDIAADPAGFLPLSAANALAERAKLD